MKNDTNLIIDCAKMALRNFNHPPGFADDAEELMHQRIERRLADRRLENK